MGSLAQEKIALPAFAVGDRVFVHYELRGGTILELDPFGGDVLVQLNNGDRVHAALEQLTRPWRFDGRLWFDPILARKIVLALRGGPLYGPALGLIVDRAGAETTRSFRNALDHLRRSGVIRLVGSATWELAE